MTLGGVASEMASNLTDGLWDPSLGLEYDILPEVPPDGMYGVVQLWYRWRVGHMRDMRESSSGEIVCGTARRACDPQYSIKEPVTFQL